MCPRLYLLSAQVVFTNPYLVHLVRYFPEASFRPKLQMAFEVPAGSCPRRVAVERRRRQFLAQDIGQLLQQAGVDLDSLTPDLSSPTDPCAERPPPPRLLPNVPPLDEVRRGTTIAGGEQLVIIISGVNVPPDFHLSPSFPYVETKTAGYKSPLPATLPPFGHASQLCTG